MNKRRASQGNRCLRCKINKNLCFCDALKMQKTNTKVSIIMHHRERYLTSNTANLATLMIENCQIHMRGLKDEPFSVDQLKIADDEVALFLFPHEEAKELNADFIQSLGDKKVHLVVPDGSWSQAVKFYRREEGLSDIQCVSLPPGKPGKYRLRKTSDSNRLSTYEAIARALEILEKDSALGNQLDQAFDTMVNRIIRSRTAFDN